MSSDENHEEDLTHVEAELASLVPRRDRVDPGWGSFLAAMASRNTSQSVAQGRPAETAACESPSGHVFVCIYCGKGGPRSTRLPRWAWPASLAAMTSAAAILLVMLLAQPDQQVADHKAGPSATSPGPSAATVSTLADDSYRAASQRRSDDEHRILTGADTALPDDFFGRSNLLASNNAAPAGRSETTERPLRSFELMQRFLHGPGGSDADFYRSILEPSPSTRSKL